VRQVVLDRTNDVVHMGPDPADTMEIEYQTIIDVARCGQCTQPTFTQYNWVDGIFEEPEQALNVRRLFPPNRNSSDLPQRVRRRYVDMLDMLHAPDAFAVRAGRLLEAVCLEQGVPREDASGRRQDLNARLGVLVRTGHVPKALADQAHLVREYRNLGGHDEDLEPTAADVPLIRDFVEALLDFLYWGPAKLVERQATFAVLTSARRRGLSVLRFRQAM
jgi:hypothetical protein